MLSTAPKRQLSAAQLASHTEQTPLTQASNPLVQSASLSQLLQPSSMWPLQLSSMPLPQSSAASGPILGLVSLQSPPGPGQAPSPSPSQAGTQMLQALPPGTHLPGVPLVGSPAVPPVRQVLGSQVAGQAAQRPALHIEPAGQSVSFVQALQPSSTIPLQLSSTMFPQI